MTAPLHICRHCDGLITDPEDAVLLGHEPGISGPGWNVWAHKEHADLVQPDAAPLRILARIRAARRESQGTEEGGHA